MNIVVGLALSIVAFAVFVLSERSANNMDLKRRNRQESGVDLESWSERINRDEVCSDSDVRD